MTCSILPQQEVESDPGAARRECLILEQLPRVRFIARRILGRLPPGLLLDDLVSAGIVGLIEAVDNFDGGRDVKLSTYASHRIHGAILDSLRGIDGSTQIRRKQRRIIDSAAHSLEAALQRYPSEDEVAQRLALPLDRYRELVEWCSVPQVGELDAAPVDAPSFALVNLLADGEERQPEELCAKEELRSILADGIRRMPRTQGLVVSMYYVQNLPLKSIALTLQLHPSRISQLKSQALARLRKILIHRGFGRNSAQERSTGDRAA